MDANFTIIKHEHLLLLSETLSIRLSVCISKDDGYDFICTCAVVPDLFLKGDPLCKEVQTWNFIIKLRSLLESISEEASCCPVDDLQKRDDAESKTEAKESSKGGDEVHRPNPNASLQLCGHWTVNPLKEMQQMFFSPMTVSLPKKMLTTAISSSQAL